MIKDVDSIDRDVTKPATNIPSDMGAGLPLTTDLSDRVRQMLTDRAGWARFPDEVREWLEMQAYRSQMPKPGQLLVETFPHDKPHYMAVSYTPLTLPTNSEVLFSVVAVTYTTKKRIS